MNKIRIGVLMGGKSIEREVSFNSGRTVCDHLDSHSYEIIPIYQTKTGDLYILPWSFLHRGKTSDFEHRLSGEAQPIYWDDLKNLVNLIYIAMHGRYAEDGTLQGFLDVLGIPYVGTKLLGSALGMDKYMQKKILRAHGILVPRDMFISQARIVKGLNEQSLLAELKEHNISFPCIVKPCKEGSSLGVRVVKSHDELIKALEDASFCSGDKAQPVLVEQLIVGMEFTSIVITDADGNLVPLGVTEVVANAALKFFDYEQKYMPGKSIQFTPARCTHDQKKLIENTACAVMKALEFKNIGRIDGILTANNQVVIIDPNSLSGAAPASFMFKQAAENNMSHTALINHLIKTELKALGMADKQIELEQTNNREQINKIRVAVLLGGASNEREISMESGRNVIYKLSPHKYEPIAVFVCQNLELFIIDQSLLVSSSTAELSKKLDRAQKISWHSLADYADFAFIALHGGAGENGAVQGTLEMLGIPYNGSSVLASALCMDKFKTNSFLRTQGFDVPAGILISKAAWTEHNANALEMIQNQIGDFPYIVKPHDDGCSVMVAKVTNQNQLRVAIDTIFADGKEHAFIEECIVGMELTVGVIGNDEPYALPPSQAVCSKDILSIEEKFLPGAGENQTPAPLPDAVLQMVGKTMQEVYKAVGCKGYARIDCFYQSADQSKTGAERVIILEINSLPGLTPATCIFHQAAEIGMKPMDFIDHIVQLGLQEHRSALGDENITSRPQQIVKQVEL